MQSHGPFPGHEPTPNSFLCLMFLRGRDGIVELAAIEAIVDVASLQKLTVLSSIYDDASVQNKDVVRPNHRGEPVGDHQCRPPHHEMIQGLLDQAFALGIQTRGCLVQNEDFGLPQHYPGNGDSLALAGTESDPPLSNNLVVPIGEGGNEFMGVSQLGRIVDFKLGRFRSAVRQILPNRPGKKHGLLGDDANVASKLLEAQVCEHPHHRR